MGIFVAMIFGMVSMPSQDVPGVSLDLGAATDTYDVGARVPVPVMMLIRNQAPVGRISLEVAYPSDLVAFREVVPGGSSQAAEAEVGVQEGEGSEGKGHVLLEVSASRPIPEGVLAELVFEVVGELAYDQEVRLENAGRSARSVEGEEIQARGIDGAITSMEFIPACLFYMH